ncbi:MAG: response regulator transcription factor [Phycisphaerales bacterium]|nr:response regulator transcription factor [Phycisphaerales bacterium]
MRILVVEDSEVLRESLVDGLTQDGHVVDAVTDGRQAVIHARTTDYDLIVLDLMLPVLDGLSALRELRSKGGNAHVLILSAKDRVEQRVEGLQAGADDYLVKPFAFDELLARVEALGRRGHGHKVSILRFTGFDVDLSQRRAVVDGVTVELTAKEFSLVECLALDAGRPVSRAQIEERIYDEQSPVWSNAIDSLVSSIRRKMSDAGCTESILTRRGVGYELPPARGSDR